MSNEQNMGSGRGVGSGAPESGMGASEAAPAHGAPEAGMGPTEGTSAHGAPEQGLGKTEGAMGSGAPEQGMGANEGVVENAKDAKGEFGMGSGTGNDQRRGSGVGRFVEKIKGKFSKDK